MAAAEHIQAAARLLGKSGLGETSERHRGEADSHSLVALATALDAIALAAQADPPIPADPLPDGVTARFVTAYGRRFNDLRATVDVITARGGGGNTQAVCRCCGRDHGYATIQRDKVLDWADEHAANCTAMPRPAAEED